MTGSIWRDDVSPGYWEVRCRTCTAIWPNHDPECKHFDPAESQRLWEGGKDPVGNWDTCDSLPFPGDGVDYSAHPRAGCPAACWEAA